MNTLSIAADVATISTAVIAALALKLAANQVASTNRSAREAAATALYNDCLIFSVQNPTLANPNLESFCDKDIAIYEWFVASILLSSEQILEITADDDAWRNSVKSNLRPHVQFLADQQENINAQLDKFYHYRLVDLAKEVIAERNKAIEIYD